MHPSPSTEPRRFRWKKVAALTVGGLVLVVGSGAVWLARNGDLIERAVRRQLDRSMITPWEVGDIELSWWAGFPRIAAVLHDVQVAGSGPAGDTLLRADRVTLAFDAWGLFRGRYVLEEIGLDGGEIRLREQPDGSWNTEVWREDPEAEATPWTVESLVVNTVRLDVEGAVVDIPDAEASGRLTAEAVEAEVDGALRPVAAWWDPEGEAIEVEGSGRYVWASGYGEVEVDAIRFGKASASGALTFEESLATTLDFEGVTLKTLTAYLPLRTAVHGWESDAQLAGSVRFAPDGSIHLEATCPPAFFRSTTSEYQGVEGDVQGVLVADCRRATWTFSVRDAALDALGLHWAGTLRGTPETATLEGQATLDLSSWERWPLVPPLAPERMPTAGTATFAGAATWKSDGWDAAGDWTLVDVALQVDERPVRCTARGSFTDGLLTVAEADVAYGDLRVRGAGRVEGVLEEAWDADLQLHLGPGDYGALLAAGNASGTSETAFLPPGCRLRLDVAGAAFTWGDVVGDRFRAEVELTDDAATVRKMTWNAWGGSTVVNGSLVPRAGGWLAEGTVQWRDIALKPFFEAFRNFDQTVLRADHLAGRLSGTADVRCALASDGTFLPASSTIDASVSLHNGALHNLEVFQEMVDALREERLMAPFIDPDHLARELRHVTLADLSIPLSFHQGILRLPELDIRSSAMDITIGGSSTWEGHVDCSIGLILRNLRDVRQDAIGDVEDDGLGNKLFFRVTGPTDNLAYRWDRDATKAHRSRAVEREKNELRSLFRRQR